MQNLPPVVVGHMPSAAEAVVREELAAQTAQVEAALDSEIDHGNPAADMLDAARQLATLATFCAALQRYAVVGDHPGVVEMFMQLQPRLQLQLAGGVDLVIPLHDPQAVLGMLQRYLPGYLGTLAQLREQTTHGIDQLITSVGAGKAE